MFEVTDLWWQWVGVRGLVVIVIKIKQLNLHKFDIIYQGFLINACYSFLTMHCYAAKIFT